MFLENRTGFCGRILGFGSDIGTKDVDGVVVWCTYYLIGLGLIPIKLKVSVKRECLIFKSRGDVELRLGQTFTSRSQGFKV